jgi:hypothetical protein
MLTPTLLVEFHHGHWRNNVGGERFGSFPTREAAINTTVQLAQASGVPGRVLLRENDGSERVLWDLCLLVDRIWQILHAKKHGFHTGPSDSRVLRDEIAYRVLDCAEQELSDDEIVDTVLASFCVTAAC